MSPSVSKAALEDRIQGWMSEPWVFFRRVFKGLAFVTLVGGVIGIAWSSLASTERPVRVRETPAEAVFKAPPSWDYYASAILKRDLFKTAAPPVVVRPKAVVAAPPPPVVHKPTLAELAADLTLVGIVNNGGLQAAIMSNRTKEVSYLSVGQKIGDITVAGIEGNRVQLSYEGETLALSL